MVRLMPQVAPISPQRRMNRSCAVRSCCAGVLFGSTAGVAGAAVNVAAAMSSPVSVCTESIAFGDAGASGFSTFSENENAEADLPRRYGGMEANSFQATTRLI